MLAGDGTTDRCGTNRLPLLSHHTLSRQTIRGRLRENSLRRELHIQRSQASALDGLRSEVYTLQRELLQDRTKVKDLRDL